MNWENAKVMLRNGSKICRPSWLENSYWVLSQDGNERIIYNGDNAIIYLKQTEALDWEIWKNKETLSDNIIYATHNGYKSWGQMVVREDKLKQSIKELKETIEEDCGVLVGENSDGTHFVDWEEINKIIKEIFGEKLCSK